MDGLVLATTEQIAEMISQALRKELINIRIGETQNNKGTEDDEYITFNQTLLLLKISRPTLFKRMNDNTVPYRRVGRRLLFPKKKIIQAIESNNQAKINNYQQTILGDLNVRRNS